MFCPNCGKELKDGEAYCSGCGAKADSAKKKIDAEQYTAKSLDIRGNMRSGLNTIGKHRTTYFLSILLLIVSIFLIGNEMFVVSYEIFYKYSNQFTLFEGNESLYVIFILCYAIAAVVMLVPLVLGKEWKKRYFTMGMCMPIASMLLFFVEIVKVLNEINTGEYKDLMKSVNVSMGLTSNGWIFLLVSVTGLLLTYQASKIVDGEKAPYIDAPTQRCKARVVGISVLPPADIKFGRDVRLTFELADGSKLSLLDKSENKLGLGDEGVLTWSGDIVVFLEK